MLNITGVAFALPLGTIFYSTMTIFLSIIGVKKQLIFYYYTIVIVDFLFVVLLMTCFVMKMKKFRRNNQMSDYAGLVWRKIGRAHV